jgi:hypothetical protein
MRGSSNGRPPPGKVNLASKISKKVGTPPAQEVLTVWSTPSRSLDGRDHVHTRSRGSAASLTRRSKSENPGACRAAHKRDRPASPTRAAPLVRVCTRFLQNAPGGEESQAAPIPHFCARTTRYWLEPVNDLLVRHSRHFPASIFTYGLKAIRVTLSRTVLSGSGLGLAAAMILPTEVFSPRRHRKRWKRCLERRKQ